MTFASVTVAPRLDNERGHPSVISAPNVHDYCVIAGGAIGRRILNH